MPTSFKRALVTGGAGFIGSHLVNALTERGCSVVVLDNLSTGKEENLESCRKSVRFIRGDIRDHDLLAEAVSQCEVVFHLAAVVSVMQTVQDPIGSAAVNEAASLDLLEAARSAGARRVVFASSSAVYGNDPALPKREDMPLSPLTPYAAQKLAVEHHMGVYQSLYGLETVCLRFFNVFGPRQDPLSPYSGVISVFTRQGAERRAADDLWRRSADTGLCLCCRRREGDDPGGNRCVGRRRSLQHRHR